MKTTIPNARIPEIIAFLKKFITHTSCKGFSLVGSRLRRREPNLKRNVCSFKAFTGN
jgi:hypothetical protein